MWKAVKPEGPWGKEKAYVGRVVCFVIVTFSIVVGI